MAVPAVLLAFFVYFFGLGNEEIPKNGDEYVYTHITRLTAQSQHWLPLQSELHQMRNTKPPLLFWQGMASTGWGESWTLWNLRWPNVLYSLLTAGLVGLVAWGISRQAQTAFLAGLIYLGFLSTYRFGRPFLTNAPEVFWLFLPFAVLAMGRASAFASRWKIPLFLGVSVGLGLLYKSFAMLAPVGLALAWWYLDASRYVLRDFLTQDVPRLLLVGVVALGLFALWFVLDPEPSAIWREFVVGENAQKFDPQGGGYLSKLLWGTSSLWSLAFGFLQNAALLALPVLALFVFSWRHRSALSVDEKRLWMLIAVFFLVFSIPSQRSARYLLDVMPAIAVLCALNWERFGRWAFVGTHGLVIVLTGLIAWISWRLDQGFEGAIYGGIWWGLLIVTVCFSLLGVLRKDWARGSAPMAALLTYLCLAGAIAPLDGPLGHFKPESIQTVQGQTVAVPYNFNAKFEVYRFVLPGADIKGYHEDLAWDEKSLAAQAYPFFVVQQPMNRAAPVCNQCVILDQRLKLHSRHTPEQIQAMLRGQLVEHLFMREYLVQHDLTRP